MSNKKMKLIYSAFLFFVTILLGTLLVFSYSSKKVLANDTFTTSSSHFFEEKSSSDSINTDNLLDDDRNIVGKFELNSENDTYLSGQEVYSSLGILINQAVSQSNLDIRIPNDYLAEAPRASSISLTNNPPLIFLDEATNEYVIRYEIPLIAAGYEGTIPFSYKTRNHLTPNNYELVTIASLTTTSGDELAKTEDTIVYLNKQLSVSKQVKNNASGYSTSGGLSIIIGEEDPDNPGYTYDETHLDKLQPVQYRFYHPQSSITAGTRSFEYWEIIDQLPPEALFREADNPDWVYDEDAHTATYSGPTGGKPTGSDSIYSPDIILYFPSQSLNKNIRIDNSANITMIPHLPGENEANQTTTASIYHSVNSLESPKIPMSLSKNGGEIYDTITDKINKEITWNVPFSNPANILNEGMTDIVIRDFNQDERLKFTNISFYSPYLGLKGTLTVIGILENDEEVVITDDYEVTSTTSGRALKIPIDEQVKELVIKTNPGTVLEPPVSTSSRVVYTLIGSKIKDPENTHLTNPDLAESMLNYTQASGKYEDSGNTWQTNNSYGTTKFLPVNTTLDIYKSRSGGSQPLYVGEQASYSLNLRVRQAYKEQRFESPVLLDLLPIGFEYVPNSATISYSTSDFNFDKQLDKEEREPEIIPNYKNTGRTALKWQLPSFTYRLNDTFTSFKNAYTMSYKTQVTKLAIDGDNVNQAYLAWENTEDIKAYSSNAVDDIYDINDNGKTDEKVSMYSATVPYRAAAELIITKEAKGEADNGYVYNENEASPISAHIEIGSKGSYRLRALNNSLNDINFLKVLDVLPNIGDKTVGKNEAGIPYDRGSKFPVKLREPIVLQPGYTAFYSLDDSGEEDYDTFYEDATWVTEVDDYSKVKAIKIEMNADHTLERNQMFEAEVPVQIDKNYSLKDELNSNNSFGVSTDTPSNLTPNYFESNNAPMQIIRYKISGHVFNDRNHNGTLDEDSSGFKDYLVELVDESGSVVNDLEGVPITAITDNKGYYEMEVLRHGNYRIKVLTPQGYEVSEPKLGNDYSHILLDDKEYLTDSFELNSRYKNIIRNAGYFKDERLITLFKYDADTLVDTNGNGIIDDDDRKKAKPLSGARFEVYEGTDITSDTQVTDEDDKPVVLLTDSEGKAYFSGPLGATYTLVEIKAPNGYELLKMPMTVTNIANWDEDELWVYVGNNKQTLLPNAGGNNYLVSVLVIFSSLTLVSLSLLGCNYLRTDNKKSRRKTR